MARLNLSPPWQIFYKEMTALFEYDSEVKLIYIDDEDDIKIKVLVADPLKAEALSQLLPCEKNFGNVTVRIIVTPANRKYATLALADQVTKASKKELFDIAFKGNSCYCKARSAEGIFEDVVTFVVFAKKVVQYFNDNLFDINGFCSTLYQEIAKSVFGTIEGVYFCTSEISPPLAATITSNIITDYSKCF